LKKSSGKGPYVLRTDRADGRSAKHPRPVATDDATGGLKEGGRSGEPASVVTTPISHGPRHP
jgi:hypothetical protein